MSQCKPNALFAAFAAVVAMAATPVFATTTTWANVKIPPKGMLVMDVYEKHPK